MRRSRGFTLLELVIVILILGIIAAVAAPKMFHTAGRASENATKLSLGIVRNAIEMYGAENGGNYPAPDASNTLATLLKPYLNGPFPAPQVGANKNADVVMVTGATTDATAQADDPSGWVYNPDNGQFVINDAGYDEW